MPSANDFIIQEQCQLTADVYLLKLKTTAKLSGYLPGKFVMVALPNELFQLRRPLAIADCQAMQGQLSLVYRTVGQGTNLLASLKPGVKLNILGALGNGFTYQSLTANDQVLLIGGGTGLPPLMFLAKTLAQKGCQVTTMAGFRTQAQVFGTAVFQASGKFLLATDDGTAGIQGTVKTLLDNWSANCRHVYACGPLGLLQTVQKHFADCQLPVDLSLESRMGCGMGACAGCMVSIGQGDLNQHVCLEGPVFSAAEVKL
ncbi:dihydroorotate dehydrogenase electron transfer subunit [Liquorilactobacillus sicerae]|uniref:dihydroorotate dehydrogenase electron transfer subunit n=1 Tax=Liquorilactobacillus sicerae TaxID=1416943 RepID=UPI0024817BA3|nr:dihydroorotate dehydrogenase electron transfer subunit [Liquorilactobacillus sicerae]